MGIFSLTREGAPRMVGVHPGREFNRTCNNYAIMKGAAALVLGVAGMNAMLKALSKRYPFPRQICLPLSIMVSSWASFVVIAWESEKCLENWRLHEEGKISEASSPQLSYSEEPKGPPKTKYGDLID